METDITRRGKLAASSFSNRQLWNQSAAILAKRRFFSLRLSQKGSTKRFEPVRDQARHICTTRTKPFDWGWHASFLPNQVVNRTWIAWMVTSCLAPGHQELQVRLCRQWKKRKKEKEMKRMFDWYNMYVWFIYIYTYTDIYIYIHCTYQKRYILVLGYINILNIYIYTLSCRYLLVDQQRIRRNKDWLQWQVGSPRVEVNNCLAVLAICD